jgi:lipopolysaccharide/colanic/teichoic acid biosynthesis glycosyltransferase
MEKRRFKTFSLIADFAILTFSFFIILALKPRSFESHLPSHLPFFAGLVLVWILVSMANGKLMRGKITGYNSLFIKVLNSNLISISLIALYMFIFRQYEYSRTVVLGTAMLSTIMELFAGTIYIAYKRANLQDSEKLKIDTILTEHELVDKINENGSSPEEVVDVNSEIAGAIENEVGPEMMHAIVKMTGRNFANHTSVLSTTSIFNITSLVHEKYDYIINLHRINDIKNPDEFLEAINRKLELKGYFFCCVETKEQRKSRLLKKYPPIVNYVYYTGDFVVKRIFPKIRYTKRLYFFLTHGENAVMSRAEVLGRLSRAGFKIKQESFIKNMLCIEARKIGDPLPANENVYGALIALPRIGKGGKMIKVYKLRTMHPYSEYIQDYVYRMYSLQEGGKFRNDFRITSWGAVCRKVWLDELPMFINFFQGDMKLVGVRPLSKHYFELYSKEVRERRIRYKPGLIPPFYADMPSDIESIQASELKYLDSYDKHPIITDFRYFWMTMWNILLRNARSK